MKLNTLIPHERFFALPNLFSSATVADLTVGTWIQAMPFAEFEHPVYGTVSITEDVVNVMTDNFRNNVYGQDIPITYEHFGMDASKGLKAAGWVQDVETRAGLGYFWKVAFTEEAALEIQQGAWRYFSPEFYDVWQNPETSQIYTYVIAGGALTNKPFFKGMVPLNFSEVLAAGPPDTLKDEMTNNTDTTADTVQVPITSDGTNSVVEWEHSEPGEDVPREDDEETIDGQGTRGPSPDVEPDTEEYAMEEFLTKLHATLGLPEDADEDAVLAAASALVADVAPLREAEKQVEELQAFSARFPAEFARLQALEQADRENRAKAFADRYATLRLVKGEGESAEATPYGFSAKTIENIESMHLAFSTGKLEQGHIESVLDSLLNTGLVNYGEVGSASEPEAPAEPAKAFADYIAQLRMEENLSHADAISAAATRKPDLFQAYREASKTKR